MVQGSFRSKGVSGAREFERHSRNGSLMEIVFDIVDMFISCLVI